MQPYARGPVLAFDTSTEAMSAGIAWQGADGTPRTLLREGAGGKASSAALIPMLLDLLHAAGLAASELAAIAFGRGPGSFTGLRTACAVAQGLAFGAGVPVLPVETLLAVAEDARERSGAGRIHAVLDARMGEAYGAAYASDAGHWKREGDIVLAPPAAHVVAAGWTVAGNMALPGHALVPALPTAAALLRLAPALLARGEAVPADQALPLYIRDKVALTTAERAAAAASRTPAAP